MSFIEDIWPYLAALIPTAGVAFLFYWIIRYMIEADRSERKALAKWNAERKKGDTDTRRTSGDAGGNPDQKPSDS